MIDPDDSVRRRDLIMSLSRVVALTDRWYWSVRGCGTGLPSKLERR
jgi:hypothetical protein